jgi:hypothetical protein
VSNDPEKALEKMAEDTRALEEGLEAELKDDIEKARGSGAAKEPAADDERHE